MSSTNAIIANSATNFDKEEVTSAYTPLKKSAWESFKGFWVEQNKLRRHPFAAPGHPQRLVKKSSDEKESAWESFKGFWMAHHNLRRHPFAAPGHPKKTKSTKSTSEKSAWDSFKGFWLAHHNLRRHPFAHTF